MKLPLRYHPLAWNPQNLEQFSQGSLPVGLLASLLKDSIIASELSCGCAESPTLAASTSWAFAAWWHLQGCLQQQCRPRRCCYSSLPRSGHSGHGVLSDQETTSAPPSGRRATPASLSGRCSKLPRRASTQLLQPAACKHCRPFVKNSGG